MLQPQRGQNGVSSPWPQLERLGLRTPRPPVGLGQPRPRTGPGRGTQIRLNSSPTDAVHAELTSSPMGLLLRDLDSSSGTFINDKRVQEALLSDQDQIRIGPFVFRYIAAASSAPTAPKEAAAHLAPPPALPARPQTVS